MEYRFLSITSSVLIVIGYLPEIINLSISILHNKKYNEYSNTIIWCIWIVASFLGCLYGIFIKDTYVIINCGINTCLNGTVFILKLYKQNKDYYKITNISNTNNSSDNLE